MYYFVGSSVCVIDKSAFLISFLKLHFLLFLVESGIAFHNLAPSREKQFNKTFSLEAWICSLSEVEERVQYEWVSLTDQANILIKFSGHFLLTTSCIRFTIDCQYSRLSGRILHLTSNGMALSLLSLKNINLRARFCNISVCLIKT